MTTFYTDLSHHDWDRAKGDLNFAQIKGETSGAVCIRATYGDPSGVHYSTYHFGDMTKMAKNAGFKLLGAYHNLVKGDQSSINRQVDWLRSEMDRYGSNWAMLDVERYQELMDNGYYPRWDDVEQFHDRWHAVDDRVLAFYIPDWVWDASLGRHSLTGLKGPLVASEYGSNPSNGSASALYQQQGGDSSDKWHAYGGRTPEILQFGSNFVCDGASSHTDVNAFRGTFDQLTALLLGEEDMDQQEVLEFDTGSTTRKVGQQFADIQNLRNFEVSPESQSSKLNPPADARIVLLHARAKSAAADAKAAAASAAASAADAKAAKEGVAALQTTVDQILDLLQTNGGQPPTVVDLSDAAVAKVADAAAEEFGDRLSGEDSGS